MKWGPEPLGTYARARVGGYKATFYRGEVYFAVHHRPFRPFAMELEPVWWTVYGCTVEKLIAGQHRQPSVHKQDEKRAPTEFNQKPNRMLMLKTGETSFEFEVDWYEV